MRNLWLRFQLQRVVARWIWTHSTKTTQECTYSIMTRDMEGLVVDMLIVTKYENGIKVTSR